jgi:hypothetical protein
MKTSYRSAALLTSFSLLLAISAASTDCWAFGIPFVGDCPNCPPPNQASDDFNVPNNWLVPAAFPSPVETFEIQDDRTAVFSSGSTVLGGLVVSNDSFGRLRMTGGSLTLLNQTEALEIGRERSPNPKLGDYNNNGFTDGADFLLWQQTRGQPVLNPGDGADGDESGIVDAGDLAFWEARYGLTTRGGQVIMTGSSTLTSNAVAVGRRSRGVLSVGPDAVVNVRGPSAGNPNDIRSGSMEVGIYGPAYITGTLPGGTGGEPGFNADGLAIVRGTVNADALRIEVFGGKGEFRLLPGGSVNLNGALVLSHCDVQFFQGGGCGLVPNPEQYGMSSKLSIIGSGGNFTVGEFDPNMSPPDSEFYEPLIRRDIYSKYPSTATMSFTADPNGVTPIVLVDNSIAFPGELTGSVYLDGTVGNVPSTYAAINLELNLDAYTGGSPLTLIDAPVASDPNDPNTFHLFGVFNPAVTFLGTTTADVNYDYVNGDVYLDNFQSALGAGTGALAGSAVPEPSGLAMTLALGLLLGSHSVRKRNGSRPGRHGPRGKSLT